jgi:outer membrane beta-barrel protein
MLLGLALIAFVAENLSFAADPKKGAPAPAAAEKAPAPSGDAEKVNVDSIKEKYWARGDETEMGVVQNRLYSKSGKFEVGLMGGIFMSDPFVNTSSLGGNMGFHFNEYFSLQFVGWKAYSKGSAALDTLRTVGSGQTTNYNSPNSYLGLEGNASFLYGKLSLVGKSIIYYDMHFALGFGKTSLTSSPYWADGPNGAAGTTVSQSVFTEHLGVGQRFYLSTSTSLRLDYRFMHYNEEIYETIVTPRNGTSTGTRSNWTHSISLGVNFLFGGGKSK